ncbi:MAG TPA: hypothetical protein VL022_06055 [Moheibacter sp.]|nr:hypothetical protein [Moheibacter sp.]
MENNQQNAGFNSPTVTEDNGKTIALIAYLTVIGLIIAFVMNNDKKLPLASFHIRQSMGIMLTGLALSFINVIPFLGTLIWVFGFILLLILWVLGLIGAINGEQKPIPILGAKFQEWFKGV